MWGLVFRYLPKALPVLKNLSVWALCAVCGLAIGAWLTSEYYEAKLKDEALQMALERAKQGEKAHAKIVTIQNELDEARNRGDSLSHQLDRLRDSARRAEARTSSSRMGEASDTECRRLLKESAELLSEGAEALRRNALTHDALAKAVAN